MIVKDPDDAEDTVSLYHEPRAQLNKLLKTTTTIKAVCILLALLARSTIAAVTAVTAATMEL